ncbi:MAG: TIGR04282 family arsenosugar biosynthesis glycosyltransferase [Stenotrophobium sp.]
MGVQPAPTHSTRPPHAPRLIVFARAPVPGRCKTRLMRRYGAIGAARIHRQLTLGTLETAIRAGVAVELWCAPDAGHGFFHACRRRFGVSLHRQPAGDLGHRMGLALAQTLARGADAAVIIGTDCAALSRGDLAQAFASLAGGSDWVVQPAADGGYVLIGARVAAPAALRGIDWSSGSELRQTLAALRRRDLSCALLPLRWDVDRPADVRRARRAGLL